MKTPGQGWARRVTKATLNEFRSLLRTGNEQAAETLVDGELEGANVPEDSSESTRVDESHQAGTDTSTLFNGIPVNVPTRYRSRPHGDSAGASTTIGPTSRPNEPSPVRPTRRVPTLADRRWFKKMSAADAQRPRGPRTNPTGHLTLVRSGHPIQPSTWFRYDLFANEEWVPIRSSSGQREEATITFHVLIAGNDLGEVNLRVTYTPNFAAGQGNRTTVVHWGTTIGEHLKQNDYTGYFVVIERTPSEAFSMVIDSTSPEPFIG